jgi:hypothetical protein
MAISIAISINILFGKNRIPAGEYLPRISKLTSWPIFGGSGMRETWVGVKGPEPHCFQDIAQHECRRAVAIKKSFESMSDFMVS